MYVSALLARSIAVWIVGLHGIDGRHETCLTVGRIAVDDDVLQDSSQTGIAAGLEPSGNAPVVKIAGAEPLMVKHHGHKLVNILGHEIVFGIDDKRFVAQERRRDVDCHILAEEPSLNLAVSPSAQRVDSGQSLHDVAHLLGQFVHAGQPALVLLPHHLALVGTHGILAQPQGKEGDAERVVVGSGSDLDLAVDHVAVHLGSRKDGRPGLCGAMGTTVALDERRNAKVAQHQLTVLGIAEEEV